VYKSGVVRRLADKGLIKPPSFVTGAVQYETIMGSMAYGVSSDASDVDVYGFCIPPKDIVFPHTAGYIPNFSTQVPNFDQFQQHHISEKDHGKQYDVSIYSIVKYFKLCMNNNPNMIDSLFTPINCVLSCTKIGEMVRLERRKFLHKGAWHTFKGYAYSQMNKMRVKEPDSESVRYEMVQKYGYDVKFAYHVVRLLNEAEQILNEGDIDLMQNREQLKSIRRGEWKIEDIEDHFNRKEKELGALYNSSKLQHSPDEEFLKQLLLNCLEEHYGSLDAVVSNKDKYKVMIDQIRGIVGY
jgi:uncharacterized protein